MKTPIQKYIDTLIVGRVGLDVILAEIRNLGYLILPADLQNRFAQLSVELSEYFNDISLESPDIHWLEERELDRMFGYKFNVQVRRPVKPAENAIKILNDDPKIYRAVTSLALAGVSDDDLQLIVGAKYNIDYEYEDIKEFLNMFFDVKNWTRKEKYTLESTISDHKLKMLWRSALDGDKDHLIWKLGLSPERSFDNMLRDLGQDCFYHFREKSKGVDPEDAIKWGTLFTRVYDRIVKKEDETSQENDAFSDLSFDLDEKQQKNIKTINELKSLGGPSHDD